MNAEQLHSVARELRDVINQTRSRRLLEELRDALQQQISQPNQAQHQKAVGQKRSDITEQLYSSEYNEWPLNRLQIAQEIGSEDIFGDILANRIERTFQENAATPEVIRSDIEQMFKEVSKFDDALSALIQSFSTFSVGFEELEDGEGEIGVIIPRISTNDLGDFTSDLKQINWELKTLADAMTGSPENFQIRTISSSDFSLFLAAIPEFVEKVSALFKSLKSAYELLLELKELRTKTAETGQATEELLQQYDATIEIAMIEQVAEIMAQIRPMYQARLDAGEIQGDFEVRVESAVKSMAARCDKGYTFTFRIGPPVIENEEEPTAEEQAKLELVASVNANNQELQQMKLVDPGHPVLPIDWTSTEEE